MDNMNTEIQYHQLAGDFNSPFTRDYIFSSTFVQYPKILGLPKLFLFTYSDNGKLLYFVDRSTWNECHNFLKEKVQKDHNYLGSLIDMTISEGEQTTLWSQKEIFDANLTTASDEHLIELYEEFIRRQSRLYAYGVTLPILDFAGFSFVENNLSDYLKSKLDSKEYSLYFEVFTQPIRNSYALDQEESLLHLMSAFYDVPNWRQDVVTKELNEMMILYPDFYKALSKHTQEYCWVYYVYQGPAFTEKEFYNFIVDYLHKKVNPVVKLQEIYDKKNRNEDLKIKYLEYLKPDEFYKTILHLAGKVVWGKPRRKDLQSKLYYHTEKLQREIGRRIYLSLSQVRSATPQMLAQGLKTGEIDIDLINKIEKRHICLPHDDGSIEILVDKDIDTFLENRVQMEKAQEINESHIISGVCAYAGSAQGIVKIINTSQEMEKMQYGDILVSLATTPSIVPAMKKASAIITDEGGLTCHASIVSRELQIPCVVGTKFASKILKDGDMVEVDATKGIVNKI